MQFFLLIGHQAAARDERFLYPSRGTHHAGARMPAEIGLAPSLSEAETL